MIVNAEQALIGALMMEPRAIKDCGSIRSDMFADALLGRKFETKKYWLEKSKLYGKQAILRWLQKENIDTTPNSWQERYHL